MQVPKYDDGTAAIVTSGLTKTIGRIVLPPSVWETAARTPSEDPTSWRREVLEKATSGFIELEDAFTLSISVVPVQLPGGAIAQQRIARCMPEDNTLGPSRVFVRADKIHFFSTMDKKEQKEHIDLVETLIKELAEARARRSGIALPTGPFNAG